MGWPFNLNIVMVRRSEANATNGFCNADSSGVYAPRGWTGQVSKVKHMFTGAPPTCGPDLE